MILHTLECYWTNRFLVDPIYYQIQRHYIYLGEMNAFFKGMAIGLVGFLLFVLILIWNNPQLIRLLWRGWLALFIHQMHNIVQSHLNKSYYSGTCSAYLYVLYGFLAAYVFFKCYYSDAVRLYMAGYLCALILYTLYLIYLPNPFVRRLPEDFVGTYIAYPLPRQARLEGKRYLVLGGSRGISRAIALRLKAQGAHVVVGCRSPKQCPYTDAYYLDIEEHTAIDNFVNTLTIKYKSFDGIILAAGSYNRHDSAANYRLFHTNTLAFARSAKKLLKKEGILINITSSLITCYDPTKTTADENPLRAYINAKYQLIADLDQLYSRHEGFRLNHFHPGIVPTESNLIYHHLGRRISNFFVKIHLMNPPNQIAEIVDAFLSDPVYRTVDRKYFNLNIEERLPPVEPLSRYASHELLYVG